MSLPYENLVTENKDAFLAKVNDVADSLSIPPEWLMVRMKNESGLNSHIWNGAKGTSCVGLIQFCPDVAGGRTKTIGKTVYNLQDLADMSNVDQMDVVYEYLKPFKSRLLSYHDLLLADLFPKALAKDDTYVLQNPPKLAADTVARNNPSYDIGKKGYITVGDVRQVGLSQFADVVIPDVTPDEVMAIADQSADSVTKFASRNWLGIAITGVVLAGSIFLLWHYKSKLIKMTSKVA